MCALVVNDIGVMGLLSMHSGNAFTKATATAAPELSKCKQTGMQEARDLR